MNTTKYVKSFSKGQITIPKEVRDLFGLVGDFWLRLSVVDGKMIIEPLEKNQDKAFYTKSLLSIKGDWLHVDEIKKNREEVEKQLTKNTL
jgi:AbrB family looped-hinge helix DNA binding protein